MSRSGPVQGKPPGRRKGYFRDFVETVLTAVALALVLRAFVVQTFRIPSGSMEDTLLVGDFLIVNKFLYGIKVPFTDTRLPGIRDPRYGDVVVFEYPNPDARARKENYVKRVIGTPGDVVALRNNALFLNGERKEETFVKLKPPTPRWADFGPIKVPEGSLFMMGDNRNWSADSRDWGFLDIGRVKGKAVMIYWSWDGRNVRPRLDRVFDVIR
ncbi:MAG: signal peptidase I [Candidatus Eisenbacteria bacterium]|nr:signal peptidase I [Candidatus Eisenbacteria bacterium]